MKKAKCQHRGHIFSVFSKLFPSKTEESVVRSIIMRIKREIRHQAPRGIRNGHGLEIDLPGTRDPRVEEALTAKELIFDPLHALNIHGAAVRHCGKISRVNDHTLPHSQGIFLTISINFKEDHSVSADALHDKASPPKIALPSRFWNANGLRQRLSQ
jgi:hypothetical protein